MSTSITPLTFTGVSTYSNDLQTILSRAVQIAQLPLTALQNQDTDALQKKTQLGGMVTPLTNLGNAVAALGQVASKNGLSASSSDSTTVSVTNTGASSPATYTISNITSIAKAASETTKTGFTTSDTTSVSANGSMELVVGTNKYDFTLTKNNLVTLRDKINSLGTSVSASILTTSQGNYLSLSSSATGQTTLQLVDDPAGAKNNLLTANNQGANASFQLNGIQINRASNVVNDVVPGLTFSINNTTSNSGTVQLTLASDRTQLSSALQTFADSYNSVVDQVNGQVGKSAGLLNGDFLVREIQGDLTALGNYQASGTIKSLSDVGINFDATGKMSFDSTKFSGLSDSQITGAFQFFGSSTTGFGALAKKFTQLTDPVTGLIKLQQDSYDTTDKRLQTQISDLTTRINSMQTALSSRLQAADALLASLASQQNTVTASVQSLNYVLYGKSTTS